jgi:hypothetical protein
MLDVIFLRSGPYLILGLVFGALSYMRTNRFRQLTGVNPWRIHPVVWGVVSVFIAIFGTILSIIACQTTRIPNRSAPAPPNIGFPRYPQPAGSAPPPPSPTTYPTAGPPVYPGAGPPAYPTGPPIYPTAAPPPGWHPDPSGRHQHRYWDGARWTEHISNGGVAGTDPVS